MLSTLAIATAANDRTLLTPEEMRAAVNVIGSAQDTALEDLQKRIAASITSECNIAIGSGAEPTLRREKLVQTIRRVDTEFLVLSRRHNVEIESVVVDGETLDEADIDVESEAGLLWRLREDVPCRWRGDKVVVTYFAGFDTVPDDLKLAASDFARFAWLESKRDPALRSERKNIFQVQETERTFWVGAVPGQGNEGAVPEVVSGQLKRFRNSMVG
jgi:hypothetical protein